MSYSLSLGTQNWYKVGLIIGVGRFSILGGGGGGGGGGGARFRILGGGKGSQIPSRHMTS